VWDDVQLAARLLRRNASFSLLAAGILALGIAASTSVFSVVEAVLLRPLPYGQPDQLVLIRKSVPARGIEWDWAAYPMIRDWSEQSRSLEAITTVLRPEGSIVTWTHDSVLDRVQGAKVLPNFFDVLRTPPLLGRTFDARTPNAVVISHRFWLQHFAGSPAVIGTKMQLDQTLSTVTGVMPPEFKLPDDTTDVWLLLTEDPRWPQFQTARQADAFIAIGRLRTTIESAQSEMATIAARLANDHPNTDAALAIRLTTLRDYVAGPRLRQMLWLLFAGALCVLLIACTNVANLLLARGEARRREIAMRRALGASHPRLIRQLLLESILLSASGGALGVLLTALCLSSIPTPQQVRINSAVLAFSIALSLLTGLLSGLAPAWQAVSSNIIGATRHGRRARGSLLAAQMALAVVLLSSAGLMIHSMIRLRAVDLGFDPSNVITMSLQLPAGKYSSQERRVAAIDQMIGLIEALPGVQAAAVGGVLSEHLPNTSIKLHDRPLEPGDQHSGWRVTSGYFRLLGIPLLEGRDFTSSDKEAVIISQSLARRYWPGQSALGKRLKSVIPGLEEGGWLTAVGVVGDVTVNGRESRRLPMIYEHARQDIWTTFDLLVRASVTLPSAAIENAVRTVEPSIPRFEVRTVEQRLDHLESQRRLETTLLLVFAATALALAAFGIHALLRFFVSLRTKEIGIRIALGASPYEIAILTINQIGAWLLTGALIGVAGSFATARLLESRLFGITSSDPYTFLVVSIVLFAVSATTAFTPIRKATEVDPARSLRHE